MERPGVAAEMQRAMLDDRRKLRELEVPGEDAPGFLREQSQEFFQFLQFARRRGAGIFSLASRAAFLFASHFL